MTDPPAAQRYRGWLEAIGVPPAAIRLLHYPSRRTSEPSWANARAAWARQLGVPAEACRPRGAGAYAGPPPLGAVGFRIVAPEGPGDQASFGFRYAIYLLAIVGALQAGSDAAHRPSPEESKPLWGADCSLFWAIPGHGSDNGGGNGIAM